jgi:predicted dehydrogenase
MEKIKIGILGCGSISENYLKGLTELYAHQVEIAACADLNPLAAKARAKQFGIPKAVSPEELLADPAIELVVNLTIPGAHAAINIAALESGKHVFVEKPFALSNDEAARTLELAGSKGLRVGCAPDTFLGPGIQTCIGVIRSGGIGQPLHASAQIVMGSPAHGTHPNPAFFYLEGGGPLMDMGPYYMTALISMLGPVTRVAGSAIRSFDTIEVTNPQSPKYGETLRVEVPTNVTALLEFRDGATATLAAANDSFGYFPRLVIYGTDGVLTVNDPNMFSGKVSLFDKKKYAEIDLPLAEVYTMNRGAGVADLAEAIRENRPHRASGELGAHVLDIMQGICASSERGSYYTPVTTVERPEPMPAAFAGNPSN